MRMSKLVSCKVGKETILLDLDSTETGPGNRELWRAQNYATLEPETLGWIDTFFKEGDVIYDIGANIGQYSLYAAKRLNKDCRVLAFEPESLNYAKLNKNIVANDLSEVITAYCLAISDRTSLSHFHVRTFEPAQALHSFGTRIGQDRKEFSPEHQQGMMGVSMDELTQHFSLPFPNHIKIDVDGTEALIIKGTSNTLADVRLKSVLVEIYIIEDVVSEIRSMFSNHNFVLSNVDSIMIEPGVTRNFIFIR